MTVYVELPVIKVGNHEPEPRDRRLFSARLIGKIMPEHGDVRETWNGLPILGRFFVWQPPDRKRVQRAVTEIVSFGASDSIQMEQVSDAALIDMIADPILRDACQSLMREQERLKQKALQIKEKLEWPQ